MISKDRLGNANEVRKIWTPLKGKAILSQEEARALATVLSDAPDLIYVLNTEVSADPVSLRGRQVRLLAALPRFNDELRVLGKPYVPQILEGYSTPPFLTCGIMFAEWSILDDQSRWRRHSMDLEAPLDCIKGIVDPQNH